MGSLSSGILVQHLEFYRAHVGRTLNTAPSHTKYHHADNVHGQSKQINSVLNEKYECNLKLVFSFVLPSECFRAWFCA